MIANEPGFLRAILVRDTWAVWAALATITALAFAYLLWLNALMNAQMAAPDMSGVAMLTMPPAQWSIAQALFVFAMWAVMMIGMMTPSAAPTILVYATVARRATLLGGPFASASWFALGYFCAWTLFSAATTAAQFALENLALLSPMMVVSNRTASGVILVGLGAYQLFPVKNACLSQCRAPLSFIQNHGGFQSSISGSLRLGFLHGLTCIGCCWALMALLFIGGVMNILWIAAIAVLVLAEKVLPGGRYLSAAVGILALLIGIWMIAT